MLFDRIRGAGASAENDIVMRACLESAAEGPATDAAPIALSYSIRVKDIGDLLSPVAVNTPPGHPAMWRRPSAGVHLLAYGSILHWATPDRMSGEPAWSQAQPIGEIDGERTRALRGKLSHDLLKPEIIGLRDVPLGDPLYLVGGRWRRSRHRARSRIAWASFRRSRIARIPPSRICADRTASPCWTRATRSCFLRPDDGLRSDRELLLERTHPGRSAGHSQPVADFGVEERGTRLRIAGLVLARGQATVHAAASGRGAARRRPGRRGGAARDEDRRACIAHRVATRGAGISSPSRPTRRRASSTPSAAAAGRCRSSCPATISARSSNGSPQPIAGNRCRPSWC